MMDSSMEFYQLCKQTLRIEVMNVIVLCFPNAVIGDCWIFLTQDSSV